jgi:hypothetical protein
MLERLLRVPESAPAFKQLAAEIGRRPKLPLVGLVVALFALAMIVALTISAGAHSDNFGDGPAAEVTARTFRPWFRIALLSGVGVALTGIMIVLLAIVARIRWLTFTMQQLLPVVIDVRREREGRPARFGTTPTAMAAPPPAAGNGDETRG